MLKIHRFAVLAALAVAGCPRTSSDPAKSQTRLELAIEFFSQTPRQLDAAEGEANKALAYMPTNEEAYNLLGLIELLRANDKLDSLEKDACLTGVDAEALRADFEAQLDKSVGRFKKAVALAPDYGEAWSNIGAVSLLQGDADRAKEAFETALTNPMRLVNPATTRTGLGWAQFAKGDMVSALRELRQALQFDPGECIATYRLGRVYFAREEWEKAAEQFQDVTDHAECRYQEAALYLMKTRLQQGLLDDARTAQAACVALRPTSCVAAQCRTASFDGGAR